MKTETEIREALAPMITTKILSRCRGGPMVPADAEILAHDIIATVAAAFVQGWPSAPPPYSGEPS